MYRQWQCFYSFSSDVMEQIQLQMCAIAYPLYKTDAPTGPRNEERCTVRNRTGRSAEGAYITGMPGRRENVTTAGVDRTGECQQPHGQERCTPAPPTSPDHQVSHHAYHRIGVSRRA